MGEKSVQNRKYINFKPFEKSAYYDKDEIQ